MKDTGKTAIKGEPLAAYGGMVRPEPGNAPVKLDSAVNQVEHTVNVQPIATQHVELRGSYRDRAVGYLIMHLPLFAAFSLAVVLVAVHWRQSPVLSWFSLNVFWLTFVGSWLASFTLTIVLSPEGVSFIEAAGRLAIVWREQTWRHNYYDRQHRGQ